MTPWNDLHHTDGQTYHPNHFLHAETQKLEAKTTTELLVSLQQSKKREAAKQRQESGKRPASGSAAPAPSSKRQQISKAGAAPSAEEQPNHATMQYTIQQLQGKNLKELTVTIAFHVAEYKLGSTFIDLESCALGDRRAISCHQTSIWQLLFHDVPFLPWTLAACCSKCSGHWSARDATSTHSCSQV